MKPIVPIIYFLGLDEILITNFLNNNYFSILKLILLMDTILTDSTFCDHPKRD